MITKIKNPIKNISLFSFVNFLTVYEDTENQVNFYNFLKNITVFPANDDTIETEYITKPDDTWVYISYKAYNTMELWWLICAYNNITNPTIQPENGTVLKIISSNYVYPIITELQNQLNK